MARMTKSMPVKMVGGNTFGKYKKISAASTFNLFPSDGWMISTYGYQRGSQLSKSRTGRGQILIKPPYDLIISVVGSNVYKTNKYLQTFKVGTLETDSNDVSMAENLLNQVAICDGESLYIFNYETGDFFKAILPDGVIPNYVCYHDSRFIISNSGTAEWYLSSSTDGSNFFWGDSGTPVFSEMETKADSIMAVIAIPGHSNMILVMGNIVAEPWIDTGQNLFPYQKMTSSNVDYGLVSSSSLAANDKYVIWLGKNQNSKPVIMMTTGGDSQPISNDGINSKLELLLHPEQSAGFFIQQRGHLLYQLTFYHPNDNFTLAYDLETKEFIYMTDENMNYHLAKDAVLYNNTFYFLSFNDGYLYSSSPDMTFYDYGVLKQNIPRVRITPNIRNNNGSFFCLETLSIPFQMGNDPFDVMPNNYFPHIQFSMSKDGGVTYGKATRYPLNEYAYRRNRGFQRYGLGQANDFTFQFRIYTFGDIAFTDGEVTMQ